jgi:hypothetical protein
MADSALLEEEPTLLLALRCWERFKPPAAIGARGACMLLLVLEVAVFLISIAA